MKKKRAGMTEREKLERKDYIARRFAEGSSSVVISDECREKWGFRISPEEVVNQAEEVAHGELSRPAMLALTAKYLRDDLAAAAAEKGSVSAAVTALTRATALEREARESMSSEMGGGSELGLTPMMDGKRFSFYREQHDFVYSERKHKIAICGRQTGKTLMCARAAAEYMMDGKRVVYAAPIDAQLEEFWGFLRRFAPWAQFQSRPRIARNPFEVKRFDGKDSHGEVKARSMWNQDGLRGQNADLVIVDEAAFGNEYTVESVLKPLLATTNGSMWLMTTPPSLDSLKKFGNDRSVDPDWIRRFWDEKTGGVDKDGNPLWYKAQIPSIASPYVTEDWVEEQREAMDAHTFAIEIEGQMLATNPGALWEPSMITRGDASGVDMETIYVGVDPSGDGPDETGIVVCGRDYDGNGWVLADYSVKTTFAREWAAEIARAYREWNADLVVAEKNNGSTLVTEAIQAAGDDLEVYGMHHSKGKYIRAEPVSLLYSRGMVFHNGEFKRLERQMCYWLPTQRTSPDRLDAMVFAMAELFGLTDKAAPGKFGYVEEL